MSEYFSRAQAQRIVGCDKNTMVKLLLSGEIKSSRKANGGWLVSKDSLNQFMARRAGRTADVAELQRLIKEYQRENRKLKKILLANGINYDSNIQEEIPIEQPNTLLDLNLPKRSLYPLFNNGIRTTGQLRGMSMADLMKLEGIGKKTATEIMSALIESYPGSDNSV